MEAPDVCADGCVAIWTELALHCAEKGEGLVVELLNEPKGEATTERAAALDAG